MGERLGRYAVLKHLATGGMADVLLGRTEGIEGFARHVVLKRIRAEHAKDQRFIQMFLDEARVAAGLHHQNIVQVYDIGEMGGEYFIAMEYIHGEDLRKLLSAVSKTRAHMPLGYVCAILSSAAAGLHYAHERRGPDKRSLNIVHRDVSPSNILIGYDGAVKVVDFGIVKAAMRQVETHSGSLKGKVSYMSPEQCKGEDVDRRSDVYALGVLLYELATTTRLFKGDNDYLVMDAIVQGKVPLPRVRRPDLPNELSSIIMRALTPDRTRRYQSADELRIALDQFAIKQGLTASTSALAGYMFKMFGERPEPWLENSTLQVTIEQNVDVDGPTQSAGQSWTEVSREEIGDEEGKQGSESARTTTGKRRRSGVLNQTAVADTVAPPIAMRETRTSMKLGWETQRRFAQAARRHKLWIAAPLAVIVVLLVLILVLQRGDDESTKVAAAQPELAPAPPAPPAPPVAPELPAVRVAGPEPVVADPPQPPPIVESTAPKKASAKKAKKDDTAKPVPVAAAPVPAPAPPPVVAAPAPPPEPPKEVEVVSLSSATVSAVASDNGRQLAACEGGAELHGDVSVSFQIDGQGKVVKSQLYASIKNPRVAGCILHSVQGWRFPKPPTGSAKGVYSVSYQ